MVFVGDGLLLVARQSGDERESRLELCTRQMSCHDHQLLLVRVDVAAEVVVVQAVELR